MICCSWIYDNNIITKCAHAYNNMMRDQSHIVTLNVSTKSFRRRYLLKRDTAIILFHKVIVQRYDEQKTKTPNFSVASIYILNE